MNQLNQLHPETAILVSWFQEAEKDTLFTYADIKAQTGVDVRDRFASVERILKRDHKVKLLTVRGLGVKLATDPEIVGHSDGRRRRARNQSRNALKDLDLVNLDELTKEDQLNAIALRTLHLATLNQMSRNARDRIAASTMSTPDKNAVEGIIDLQQRKRGVN